MPTIVTTLTRRCARVVILSSLLLLAAEVVESVLVNTAALRNKTVRRCGELAAALHYQV
jgi:hypothetical protein